jgi:hypothetical protein
MQCGIPSNEGMGSEALTSEIIPQNNVKEKLLTHNFIPQTWKFSDTHNVITAMTMA